MTVSGHASTRSAGLWPESISCAIAFTFDFDAEEVWLADDPANARRLGVLSQGTYGAKVGVPLVLDLLARLHVTATFFVPGRVAERHPEQVHAIVAAGHELGHHGYTHVSPTALTREEEERELARGKEVLQRVAPIAGYRSPSWDFSDSSLGLLQKHGFAYSSNLMDDIKPYRHEPTGIVELPVHWLLDDASHFWFAADTWEKKIATVSEVEELWRAEMAGICGLGGCCILTLHPQLIGRPGRLGLLDTMIGLARATPGAWIAPAGEIAAHVAATLGGARPAGHPQET
jgi:peptidoglycan/xylan/chitin deacetylase (PgdA/CDA1 family)